MKKRVNSLFFLTILGITLTSCSGKTISRNSFYFDTYIDSKLFEGSESDLDNLNVIYSKIDKLTDNFHPRSINNIYTINNSSEEIEIDPQLYELLELTFSHDLSALTYFNPLCGSLSKAWKTSLEKNEVLSQQIISEELAKMSSSSLEFLGENKVKRIGEAGIDLGAVAKGYVLDKAKEYFDTKNYTNYLIDAGSSSILLGEKSGGNDFKIKISDLDNCYLNLKNCFVSTSSFLRQKVEINGVNYSHIINPVTGSAVNENDVVIVVSNKGYLGDILSTAFINESLDSIKEFEKTFDVKTIVIKNNTIVYKNEGIEVTNKWKKNTEMTSY